jgi:hypothetical protein
LESKKEEVVVAGRDERLPRISEELIVDQRAAPKAEAADGCFAADIPIHFLVVTPLEQPVRTE